LLLSLLQIIGPCESGSCWHHRYLHLSIEIHLSDKLGGWIAGPVLIFEQLLLHAVRICLGLDFLITTKDALFKMPWCEHAEKGVNSSDDKSSHVDTIDIVIMKDDGKDVVSEGGD